MKQSITTIVLTKNEENNIEKCLSSLSWCDEIVIVDDYSEDRTVSGVRGQGSGVRKKIKVFKRRLDGNFASQRNFGLSKTKGDWVLFIDADEVVTDELKKEILSVCHNVLVQHNTVGYYLKRRDYFLGRWLKHGETANIKLLRLARKNSGVWRGRVHEVWEVRGKVGELENPFLHYPHQSVSQFLKEINWFTDLVAQCWRGEGRRVSFWAILCYPAGKFLQNYIFRAGFLDGVPGLIMAFMMSFHSFLARSKLWLQTNFSKPGLSFHTNLVCLYLIYFALLSIILGPLGALPVDIPAVNVYLTDIFAGSLVLVWIVNWSKLMHFVKKDAVAQSFFPFVVVALVSLIFSPIHLSMVEKFISSLYLLRFVSYFFIYVTIRFITDSSTSEESLAMRGHHPRCLHGFAAPGGFLSLLTSIGLILAVLGWLQYYLYPDLRNLYYLGWDPHYRRIFGSFLDPNYLGLMMVLALLAPFSLENLQRKCHPEFIPGSPLKRMLKRVQHDTILVWMIKCFLFVTLMFTYSRSSFLALTASAFYLSVIRKKVLILGLVLFILALSAAFLPRPGGEGVKLERVFSIEQRIENWKLGYRIFLKHPLLGVGFNTTRFAKREQGSPQEDWFTNHSGAGFENSFLYVLVTTGIVGFTSYLLLLRQIFKSGNLITKTSLIAIITHSLFLNSLFFPWIMLWLWVMVGVGRGKLKNEN